MSSEVSLRDILYKFCVGRKNSANLSIERLHSNRPYYNKTLWQGKALILYGNLYTWRAAEILLQDGLLTLLGSLKLGISKRLFHSQIDVKSQALVVDKQEFEQPHPIHIMTSDSPRISIVIPVHNKFIYTFNCLHSIQSSIDPALEFEVIVVDDASIDETTSFIDEISGVRVLRNSKNLGFIASCNYGAAEARGELVCFLNNDTKVLSGWLESLLALFDSDAKVGAVGSKLIYPDGRLQEAGGVIWNDANGWNYGKFKSPNDPEYNYVRPVDYCSGASLLVRKDLFEQLGGFSDLYSPAYYEDTDLCFSIRKAGYKVLYQPKSQIVHYEGITSGTDLSQGVKKNQEINRVKFYQKWKDELSSHFTPEDGYPFTGSRRLLGKPTILMIDDTVPLYDKEAGCLRIFNIIQIFLDLGYSVIFCPDDAKAISPYTEELQQMGVEVLYAAPCNLDIKQQLRNRLPVIDIAWISRPFICNQYLDLIRQNPRIKTIYDTVDLHFLRLKRQAAISQVPGMKDDMWKQIQDLEFSMARSVDTTVVVTHTEKEVLSESGITNVQVIPTIHQLYSGEIKRYDQRSGILFIGGYKHQPNVDAVIWLCHEIMPIIWQDYPDISITLLGSSPPPEVLALASSKVDVPGFIPDVETYFLNHRVFVAPLRFGAGMKGKIGQSLSYSLPVVTTSIGAEGIGLVDDVNVLIADDAPSFAEATLKLYNDKVIWERLSTQSHLLIKKYSPQSVKNTLQDLVNSLNEKSSIVC